MFRILLVVLALLRLSPGPGPGPGDGCPWLTPVEAGVVDGFRPPSHPYGPGNRGLEYGTTAGQPVSSVAAGTVTFVGPVGGRRYVVVTHDRALRSTYGPLRTTTVARGERLEPGQRLGTAEEGLHLTARVGDRYIDPGPLLDGRCGRPRLVVDVDREGRAGAGRSAARLRTEQSTYLRVDQIPRSAPPPHRFQRTGPGQLGRPDTNRRRQT